MSAIAMLRQLPTAQCEVLKLTRTCVSTAAGCPDEMKGRYSHRFTVIIVAGINSGGPWRRDRVLVQHVPLGKPLFLAESTHGVGGERIRAG
jgi:hypothetical protein